MVKSLADFIVFEARAIQEYSMLLEQKVISAPGFWRIPQGFAHSPFHICRLQEPTDMCTCQGSLNQCKQK